MTEGTSPHGGDLSRSWADSRSGVGRPVGRSGWLGRAWRAPPPGWALGAVSGLIAGLALTTAWQATGDSGGLALLGAAGAALTGLGLGMAAARRAAPHHGDEKPAPEAPSPLLAQMQHDLRTPLNAMIGFSEAMQRELHGPLGSTRYHEYAAHISESGGRLLKASEDALAVAATMSALVASRRNVTRDRLPIAGLLEEAWAAVPVRVQGARLDTDRCASAELECDWQITSQALQLLLGEAVAHLAPGGSVVAASRREGNARCIELAVAPAGTGAEEPGAAGSDLRLILVRSLLDLQGATLSVSANPCRDGWKACIAFPARAAGGGRRSIHRAGPGWRPAAGPHAGPRVPRVLQSWC